MEAGGIAERLEHIRIAQGRAVFWKLLGDACAAPLMVADVGGVQSLYARFQAACPPANKDNVKIFVLLAFFVYAPASLVSKRMPRGRLRKELGRVLGISGSAVTRHFADAKSLFLHHKGFREEAERLFAAMRIS